MITGGFVGIICSLSTETNNKIEIEFQNKIDTTTKVTKIFTLDVNDEYNIEQAKKVKEIKWIQK